MKAISFVRHRLAMWSAGLLLGLLPLASGCASDEGDGLVRNDGRVALAPTGLAEQLDGILASPLLEGALAGVVVRDARTGEVLYSHRGNDRLVPASNAKLLTAAAALEVLGTGHRFETSVWTDGQRRGPILQGNLYLKGTGDPSMLAQDYDALAAKLADSGLTFVQGELWADDTWFDDVRLGSGWEWEDEPFYYAAQVSALTVSPDEDFDAGNIVVDVNPGSAVGQPPRVALLPNTDYITIDNRAITAEAGSSSTLSVERQHGTNTFLVTGSMPLGADTDRSYNSVSQPTGYAAAIFRAALEAHGVRVLAPATHFGPTPSSATQLLKRSSPPLSELLPLFLKLSNNGHAEILTKTMGKTLHGEGSWDAGIQVISEFLSANGVDANTLQISDGSGLSRHNLISAAHLTALLLAVRNKPWFATFYDALPIAGVPQRLVGGTLRSRMKNTAAAGNVHAKTGNLDSVSSLSGYVTSAAGDPLVFSILLNHYLQSGVARLEDAIAITLANSGANPRVQPPAPPIDVQARPRLECGWTKGC
ncbi:D-alanyl-D-alanine carboxypeptidase/D-alanyl-D-alanine-endopeptidase [Pendulispora brunnea]|uniref:D-alanyl-D-alanine carboxypeptidase/D-alanyl-D-alanine-endopeptidase n=1 Tax=Pendulispora brunnea TaxID=2905690 RepID=A0ABZ2JUY0_9BACT